MKTQRNRAVGCSAWLDDLEPIKQRQRIYAELFERTPWTPDMLSEIGHLGLVDVPMLVTEVEKYRKKQGKHRNANGDPRPNGVRSPKPSLQLVMPEQSKPKSLLVVEARNPLAHLLIVFIAKLPLGIRLWLHTSNYNSTKVRFVYFAIYPGNAPDKRNAQRRRFTANTTRR